MFNTLVNLKKEAKKTKEYINFDNLPDTMVEEGRNIMAHIIKSVKGKSDTLQKIVWWIVATPENIKKSTSILTSCPTIERTVFSITLSPTKHLELWRDSRDNDRRYTLNGTRIREHTGEYLYDILEKLNSYVKSIKIQPVIESFDDEKNDEDTLKKIWEEVKND